MPLCPALQYLLTRIQELNELVEGEYIVPGSTSNTGSASASLDRLGGANGSGGGNGGGGAAQPQLQAVAAGASWSGSEADGAQPLHSTASSSLTLESEVFMVDGAASSIHTRCEVFWSHVAQKYHPKEASQSVQKAGILEGLCGERSLACLTPPACLPPAPCLAPLLQHPGHCLSGGGARGGAPPGAGAPPLRSGPPVLLEPRHWEVWHRAQGGGPHREGGRNFRQQLMRRVHGIACSCSTYWGG